MGNQQSGDPPPPPPPPRSFPGSALLDGTAMMCGIDTTQSLTDMCITDPEPKEEDIVESTPSSALFARALVSEVTDNPNTMTVAQLAEREKKLLKAQDAAKRAPQRAVGGKGQASLLGSIQHYALGQSHGSKEDSHGNHASSLHNSTVAGNGARVGSNDRKSSVEPPSSMQENRAQREGDSAAPPSKHRITVGLSLSRRHSTVGHADTVTRQTAFDFNELQDREYKYVSSTDSSGWRAGGGERGGKVAPPNPNPLGFDEDVDYYNDQNIDGSGNPSSSHNYKIAAPDTVHIPIIHIDADSPQAVDSIIDALARGEVFIPHMAVLPEALSVNGISPPDLVVKFGCERNEDSSPDEWPNWCLEFMHNQLYEYFVGMGAKWMKRPFQITLAKKVRWKTVKHMNRYFAHAERVLDAWREKGPQYLDPQLSYIEGGATPEEVARPHGIYLLRNGVPTNYFSPNFDPPYTTKMTRSLLMNVLDKSWDRKRREWTSEPVPRLVTPQSLLNNLCGADSTMGFMANQVTTPQEPRHLGDHNSNVCASVLSDDDDANSLVDRNSATPTPVRDAAPTAEKPSYKQAAATKLNHKNQLTQSDYHQNNTNQTRALTPEKDAVSEVAQSTATTVQYNNYDKTLSAAANAADSKRKKKTKQEKDAELAREIAKVALTQDTPARPAIVEEASKDPKKMELAQAVADYEEKKSETPVARSPTRYINSNDSTHSSVQRSDSNLSLEYSMDSSMWGAGDSQTTGQYFNPTQDKTKPSKSSVASSTRTMLPKTSEDEASTYSGQTEPVPSDQELFAVGWAKALDTKSGSYYYFTLDRSKIVWDNPLSDKSIFSGGSSYSQSTAR